LESFIWDMDILFCDLSVGYDIIISGYGSQSCTKSWILKFFVLIVLNEGYAENRNNSIFIDS
jgi:hypothetical protein